MRVGINQLVASLAVAVYAGFAWFSGLDRLAGEHAGVPAPRNWAYARNAPLDAANAAVERRQWSAATAHMASALIADPVNEATIGSLGQVRQMSGDHAGADAAFRVSAMRGWRFPTTHAYWLEQSLKLNDFGAAALQADALLRKPMGEAAFNTVIGSMLDYEESRDALALRLAHRPPWANDFVVKITMITDETVVARADVAIRAGANAFTCSETAGIIDRLITVGSDTQATQLYHNSCPRSAGLIHDSQFIRFAEHQPTSWLDWYTPENGQIVPAKNDPTGVALSATNEVTQPVLMQKVAVSPGTYRLAWQMPDTPPALADKLVVNLSCPADLANARPGVSSSRGHSIYTLDFKIDNSCAIYDLVFWSRPFDGTIKIDNVTLEKSN